MATQAKNPITSVGLVSVSVSDQDKALNFYTEKLGFDVTTDETFGEGMRWLEVSLPGNDVSLALFKPMKPDHPAPGTLNNVHLKTGDIESAYEELGQRGVEFEGPIMRMGDPVPPMAFFRDPDGNRFMLVQDH